ncbi:MAG: hypothetical protein H0T79_04630, partial [Deltaproteobacteria bacterium]|nr:hypothetical protein [Deltaproteobacteria bacterium]
SGSGEAAADDPLSQLKAKMVAAKEAKQKQLADASKAEPAKSDDKDGV